jgi:hypothetical protein
MSDVGASAKLDLGRVIQQLFAVLGRNFVTFLVLAAIFVGVPALIAGYLQMTTIRAGQLFSGPVLAGGLLAALGALILQGIVIYGTVTDLNGRRATVTDCLSVGLRSFLPILGIGIMWYFAIVFGLVLLVVPGLMLLVAWAVCIPVYVIERTSLTGVFGRSAELTRGNRWRIFGLFVLYVVALIIVEAVLGVFGNAGRIAAGGGVPVLQAMVIMPLINIANALIGTTGGAALYVELRRIKDGVGAESLAAIFD